MTLRDKVLTYLVSEAKGSNLSTARRNLSPSKAGFFPEPRLDEISVQAFHHALSFLERRTYTLYARLKMDYEILLHFHTEAGDGLS